MPTLPELRFAGLTIIALAAAVAVWTAARSRGPSHGSALEAALYACALLLGAFGGRALISVALEHFRAPSGVHLIAMTGVHRRRRVAVAAVLVMLAILLAGVTFAGLDLPIVGMTAGAGCLLLVWLRRWTRQQPAPLALASSECRSAQVVVVGAGFGGLYAARSLARRGLSVLLLDRTNYHLFQPLLYQVASAVLSAGEIAEPIRAILRKYPNTRVLLGEVVDIDVARREVRMRDGHTHAYEYLVVATGSRHSYFDHPEWEPFAPGLKSLDDALEIRRRILLAFELAEREDDRQRRDALLTFVVVGGGPTGVELAGAIAEIACQTLAHDFRSFDPRSARVILV